MADQQQLDLLQQRVKDWNTWRVQHPEAIIDLIGANLSGANLSGASLIGANLSGADLNETYLSGAVLIRANLRDANLRGANLMGADLRGANLMGADLRGANLIRADLIKADLKGANLRDADLSGADLRDADLIRADLIRANLSEATIGRTVFGDVDLRTVKGLETVRHYGPSTIGADTLLRSQGDIPEPFLRKAGLTNTFITYVRSLTQNTIEYYTCFISYSSKDQDFAKRLYADLQSSGIRCWFAPEDLKIGEEFRHRIDESIRVYDKLIVILSQHSIDSSWVEYEVNKALKKEQDQGKLTLFPITLDEAIKDAPDAWAAAIRRKRHIGDFTKWKKHDAYQMAFQRLLRDLQTSTIPPISKP